MLISDMNAEDINRVIERINPAESEQMRKLGWEMEGLRAFYLSHVGKPFSISFLTDTRECVAIVAAPFVDNVWHVVFCETWDAFYTIGSPLTRFIAKITTDMVNRVEGSSVEIRSSWGSGRVRKWYEAMGFKMVESPVPGEYRYMKTKGT